MLYSPSDDKAGTNELYGKDFKTVNRILAYLTPTWITSLLHFLSQHAITTNLDEGQLTPPLQRERDEYIMNIFLQRRPNYSIRELRALNRVRLYLQVYSRACITHRSTHRVDIRLLACRSSSTEHH